jgi:hypothetical protein
MRIAVYSIALNEAAHAERWAASTVDADFRLVADTGSTDDTVELLGQAGVTVARVTVRPWRFDLARNAALALLPDDIDVCLSLDLDEVCEPGFFDAVRAAWDEHGGFGRGRHWIHTGTWWRAERLHARFGYRWVGPCHEVTVPYHGGPEKAVDVEARLHHLPDDTKSRGQYLGLLEMFCAEAPHDPRAWTYLTRERFFAQDAHGVLDAAARALALPGGWPPERAAICRWAAWADPDHVDEWLARGTMEAPDELEAWHARALVAYARAGWVELGHLCERALACPDASHYLAGPAWRLHDLAALAAHHQDDQAAAVTHGEAALAGNPDDERLAANLAFYQAGVPRRPAPVGARQAVPTYVVIASRNRPTMLANLRAQLAGQCAGVLVFDNGYDVAPEDVIDAHGWPLHRMWNDGLDRAAAAAGGQPHNCLVINDDVELLTDDFVARLDAALRSDPDHWIAYPNFGGLAIGHGDCGRTTSDELAGQTMSGWAFMLRGEAGLRIDEQFAFWYGDTDLERQVRTAGKHTVCVGGCFARHLDPCRSTFTDPERLAQAFDDEARYAAKWDLDPDTLWLAINAGPLREKVGRHA